MKVERPLGVFENKSDQHGNRFFLFEPFYTIVSEILYFVIDLLANFCGLMNLPCKQIQLLSNSKSVVQILGREHR